VDRNDEEQVSWMAMASGTYFTDESKQFQVGSQSVGYTGAASTHDAAANLEGNNATRRGGFTSMHFRGAVDQQREFAAKELVILTQNQSNNDPGFVKTRQLAEVCEVDRCVDSWDPTLASGCHVAYSWVEISEVGTRAEDAQWTGSDHAMDDGWFDVDIYQQGAGFTFPWFGIDESIISIGTNGVITFGSAQFQYGSSEPVPCAGVNACPGGGGGGSLGVDGAIAVLWADLDLSNQDAKAVAAGASNSVFHQTTATGAVVQYNQVSYFCAGDKAPCQTGPKLILQTFQKILKADGSFLMQYKDMAEEPVGDGQSYGADHVSWSSPSIGFEDQTGTEGQQIMFDQVPAGEKQIGGVQGEFT
jgi:hypothetical protein